MITFGQLISPQRQEGGGDTGDTGDRGGEPRPRTLSPSPSPTVRQPAGLHDSRGWPGSNRVPKGALQSSRHRDSMAVPTTASVSSCRLLAHPTAPFCKTRRDQRAQPKAAAGSRVPALRYRCGRMFEREAPNVPSTRGCVEWVQDVTPEGRYRLSLRTFHLFTPFPVLGDLDI